MAEVSALLQTVASELSFRVVRRLAGGEFGAALVVDGDARELVLKAIPSPDWADRFAQGADLAQRLRERGYPAPRYVGTGSTGQASWSLQELLPGSVPDKMTMPHARRLVELAGLHAGAAGRSARWRDETLATVLPMSGQLADSVELRGLAAELARVIEASGTAQFLDDGIVHSDFHHRNYLAQGHQVTGVFDWELASVGDWRADLVTLAFWSSVVTEQVPSDVAAYVTSEMKSRCPAEVIAFFAACRAITQLDFAARVHPDRVAALTTSIQERIAPWWRDPG
jgi:aminoglycoside phosphotransferase (APT) family kinase protein